jgi:4-amino-4-deoxy-L-arabinose transferase-like glycosyltransferase
MHKLLRTLTLPLSLLLFAVLWLGFYHHLKYILDADAVGYLSIAERVANGDYFKSINGLWSPLNSWLLVPFIQKGYDAFTVALYLNAAFSMLCIVLCSILYCRFIKDTFYLFCASIATSIVFAVFTYFQVFGDILMLVFILSYLLISTKLSTKQNLLQAILAGLLCGIAYYAKTYAFPFLILHTALLIIWEKWNGEKINWVYRLLPIFICLITILPWAFQLQKKYGSFSLTGNSSKLNMSWYIESHKSFKPVIKYLIPPTYNDSPSFWEDPYFSQAKLSTPFSSSRTFIRWCARVVHTCVQAIICYSQISCISLIALIAALIWAIRKKEKQLFVLCAAAIAITAGYLSMHIETRYIWLCMPLCIIAAAYFIEQIQNKKLRNLASIGIAFSIIAFPIYQLEEINGRGRQNFELATRLNDLKINKKRITSNEADAGAQWASAYLSKNQFYTIENFNFTSEELCDELARYKIEYFIYQHNGLPNMYIQNSGNVHFNFINKVGNYSIFKIDYYSDEHRYNGTY